jgi:hypothetical protein
MQRKDCGKSKSPGGKVTQDLVELVGIGTAHWIDNT